MCEPHEILVVNVNGNKLATVCEASAQPQTDAVIVPTWHRDCRNVVLPTLSATHFGTRFDRAWLIAGINVVLELLTIDR